MPLAASTASSGSRPTMAAATVSRPPKRMGMAGGRVRSWVSHHTRRAMAGCPVMAAISRSSSPGSDLHSRALSMTPWYGEAGLNRTAPWSRE
ncbi:hypothetical protein DSECCO2_636500 [anaerobic digester metagenome]